MKPHHTYRFGLLALLTTTLLAAAPARAEELTIGVFMPQTALASNADRAAWAERLARHITTATNGRITARAEVFARRDDARTFSKRVDILIADGLFAADLAAEAIAHLDAQPNVGLYAQSATNISELQGKPVAYAASSDRDHLFYTNTALGGEVVGDRWFSEFRDAKDAGSALNMVRTGSVPAAFGPVDHPATAGLRLIHQGGVFATGVAVIINATRVNPLKDTLIEALLSAPGGPAGSFRRGGGDAFARVKAARGTPRVLTTAPVLAENPALKLQAPPIRLEARGKLPETRLDNLRLPPTALREEP
jgi:hypothetical protein